MWPAEFLYVHYSHLFFCERFHRKKLMLPTVPYLSLLWEPFWDRSVSAALEQQQHKKLWYFMLLIPVIQVTVRTLGQGLIFVIVLTVPQDQSNVVGLRDFRLFNRASLYNVLSLCSTYFFSKKKYCEDYYERTLDCCVHSHPHKSDRRCSRWLFLDFISRNQ